MSEARSSLQWAAAALREVRVIAVGERSWVPARDESPEAQREASFMEAFLKAPDSMCIARVSDAMMYEINDAFERVSGYKREQVVGHSSYEFPWWPNAAVRDHVLGKLRDQGYLENEEVSFISGAVQEVVSLISASPIMFHGERCVVWRGGDITSLRRSEEAQRRLEERLRQKQNLERLGLLAGGIAHDFNNLLVGVLGNADLLLSMVGEDSPLAPPLRTIFISTQRMAEHTRELLDYAGHTAVKLAGVRLDALLEDVIEIVRPLIRDAVELRLERASAEPVWIRGDSGQLTRLFVNLIKNGTEALDGKPGSIVVSLSLLGGEAQIRVQDSGQGMDEGTRARMFDPFFSTKVKGYGLGLASAPSIVERHGGTLSVESDVGRGTTVVVRIPLQSSVSQAPPPPLTLSQTGPKGRVLVVDDEPQVRGVARAMLTRLGFDVAEAEDGMKAVEIVRRDPHGCSLVILDATMPGLDGAATLERLRSVNAQLPVLLCSGYSQADFKQLLAHQPRTSFLTKPFRAEQLASAVAGLLNAERNARGRPSASERPSE